MTSWAWAEALLREVHPAAVVTELVARTGGEVSTVYEVRYEDPSHTVILKVYAHEWAWKPDKEIHRIGQEAYGYLATEILASSSVSGWLGRNVRKCVTCDDGFFAV